MREISNVSLTIGILAIIAALLSRYGETSTHERAEIYFLNVGQGDASLIQIGNAQFLIDGGPDQSVVGELGRVMRRLDRSLEAVILTHPDRDHLNGLRYVVERYEVGVVLLTGVARDTVEYRDFVGKLTERNIPLVIVQEGVHVSYGKGVFTVLSPPHALFGRRLERTNNTGVVTHLAYGTHSFLFTADIDEAVEKRLLTHAKIAPVTVLKVAHHGSKTSSDIHFLRATSPQIAVISSGKGNRYGHPSSDVLARVASVHAQLFRTDQAGTIGFVSDGETLARLPAK